MRACDNCKYNNGETCTKRGRYHRLQCSYHRYDPAWVKAEKDAQAMCDCIVSRVDNYKRKNERDIDEII